MELSPWNWTVSPGDGVIPGVLYELSSTWTTAKTLIEWIAMRLLWPISSEWTHGKCDCIVLRVWMFSWISEEPLENMTIYLYSPNMQFHCHLCVIIYKMERLEESFWKFRPQVILNRITWTTDFQVPTYNNEIRILGDGALRSVQLNKTLFSYFLIPTDCDLIIQIVYSLMQLKCLFLQKTIKGGSN